MSTAQDDPRFAIAAARRMLYRAGLDSQIGGHVSLRAGDDSFLVSPFQYFDETLPEDVLEVGFDLKVRSGHARTAPGVAFHADIYRARPDVDCVIHTHSRLITTLTTTGQALGMYHLYSSVFLDDLATFTDEGVLTAEREGELIVEALGDRRGLLMSHHGAINVGPTIELTTAEAMLLEICAGYQLEALKVGGHELPRASAESYRDAYMKFGLREEMWNANLRRLRRSDPELFEARSAP